MLITLWLAADNTLCVESRSVRVCEYWIRIVFSGKPVKCGRPVRNFHDSHWLSQNSGHCTGTGIYVWQIVGWVSVYSQCSDPRVLVYVRAASDQHRGQRRPDITQNKAADSLDLASINVLAVSTFLAESRSCLDIIRVWPWSCLTVYSLYKTEWLPTLSTYKCQPPELWVSWQWNN